jgi:hypothetical protein
MRELERGIGIVAAAAALVLLAREWQRRRRPMPPATRAYLAVRRLLARREGSVSPATPPAEVARRVAAALPAGAEDAGAVVRIYAESAFGGKAVGAAEERDLDARVRRLERLA